MPESSLPSRKLSLVTGPARSGKSEWAELLAARSGKSVVYVATARVDLSDRDWQQRIAAHQRRRPAGWQTQYVPIDLAGAIGKADATECLLIDSLGTWLANLLEQDEDQWGQTLQEVVQSLERAVSDVVLVAEETGWGVVPAYPIGRLFRDRLGQLTRRMGSIACTVYLVTGGYVLNLSELGTPLPQDINLF